MTSQRYTSRAMQFRARLLDRLAGAVWPPIPDSPDWSPHIGWDPELAEYVMVDRVASQLQHAAQGPTLRDERITATIVIFTGLVGRTEQQCMDRLEELADVAQRLFFDDQGPFPEPVSFDLAGEVLSAEITRFELFPGRTEEGFEARCEIDVSVATDI